MPSLPSVQCIRRVAMATTIALLGVCTAVASAQDAKRLPPGINNVRGTLNADQRQAAEAFIAYWLDQLATAVPSSVKLAKTELANPLKSAISSDDFKGEYSRLLANGMERRDIHEHPSVLVRLNAMIIAGYITGDDGIPTAAAGLADDNPGVRFAASASLNRIASVEETETNAAAIANLHRALFSAITGPAETEAHPDVRHNLYRVLNANRQPEARRALLKLLAARADDYAKYGVTDAIYAEADALDGLRRKIVEMWVTSNKATQQSVVKPIIRDQAAVSGKYVQLIARYLTGGGAFNGRMQAISLEIAEAAERSMNYGLDKFDPEKWDPAGRDVSGPALLEPLRRGEVGTYTLGVIAWVGGDVKQGLLPSEKIAIDAEALALPKRVEAASAADPSADDNDE